MWLTTIEGTVGAGSLFCEMDEIVDTIRQNLERVKEREAEVVRQEAALKAEVNSIKEKTDALDEARLEFSAVK